MSYISTGGFRNSRDRLAAQTLLDGVTKGTCAMKAFDIPVIFCSDWSAPWPCRPSVAPHLILLADPLGKVDLAPWYNFVSAAPGSRNQIATSWWEIVTGAVAPGVDVQTTVYDLLRVAVGSTKKHALAFTGQLLWAIGMRAEAVLHTSALRGRYCDKQLHAQFTDILSLLGSARLLDSELVRHVLASRDATLGSTQLSWATDKVQACFHGIVNTIVAMEDNQAFVALPQVVILLGVWAYTRKGPL